MNDSNLNQKHLLFVTGRLAEVSLREVVGVIAEKRGFKFEVAVPGIQVAALMHVNLLKNRLQVPDGIDLVLLPGWVQGDIEMLAEHFGVAFERGPKNLHDLPEHFGLGKRKQVVLDRYSVDIIGEINHATKQPLEAVMAEAKSMVADGANLIDVGCVPGETSDRITEIVTALKDEGIRISIDSFDQAEVEAAVAAGAELILSCNHSNIDWVSKLGVEVVAIPDSPSDEESLDRIVEHLMQCGTSFRIDPIIEPIGMGFTASLERYMKVRRRFPDAAMMMGVGNITELTEVDSAGVNVVLAAVCEELGIQSILTTQVINWCRSAVKEFDAARKLMHYAVSNQVVPKHLNSALVMLRDARFRPPSEDSLKDLASKLTDPNFRIAAAADGLHLMNRQGHWVGSKPFEVFANALNANPNIDAGHAFYLGFEMARAQMCRELGKDYIQDQPVDFGLAGSLPGSGAVRH
ncbi:MAG: DUF6513 domain-containing protein [Fuerstiella sp.]